MNVHKEQVEDVVNGEAEGGSYEAPALRRLGSLKQMTTVGAGVGVGVGIGVGIGLSA